MIVREFNISDLNLHYFVGINQIKIEFDKFIDIYNISNKNKVLSKFFSIVEEIQDKNDNSIIQFFKDKYILNQDHIFTACYYLEKAFLQNINISNKKNIELLLYLAANRQISRSIEGFGIDYSDISTKKLTYCIISPIKNLGDISTKITITLNAKEEELTINNQSNSKINLIKEYFEISENQLNSILKSYEINTTYSSISISFIVPALYDLICEKMAILHLEKGKSV